MANRISNDRHKLKLLIINVAIAITSTISIAQTPTTELSGGEYNKNGKVIVTDVMDDDIRALTAALGDPEMRGTIKAFVVSTGNTFLKAAVLRKIVAGFGLKIPVYAGTATDLSNNSVTSFAANYEQEGKPLLSDSEIRALRALDGHSGDGAQKLAKIFREAKSNEKIDVLLLTAPTDIVKAIQIDSESAERAAGILIAMGLYKKNAKGELISPYNPMADTLATKNFFEIIKPNPDPNTVAQLEKYPRIFEKIVHVASDVVQNHSGLPGGYIPEDGEGKTLMDRLFVAMKKNPVLDRILSAAGEYSMNWKTTAIAKFGMGFNSFDRWVVGTFADPNKAAGFYMADMIPTMLMKLSRTQLQSLDSQTSQVKTPQRVSNQAFMYTQDPEGRELHDLKSIDGWEMLRRYVRLMEESTQFKPDPTFFQETRYPNLRQPESRDRSDKSNIKNKNALILVFKNSPDDWFGLLEIVANKKGRDSLSRGGIICEGFETLAMRNSVLAVLQHLEIKNVHVAAGTNYSRESVEAIPNFKGEIQFNKLYQHNRAFLSLQQNVDLSQARSIEEILDNARIYAESKSAAIDAVLLGEGIDLFKKVSSDREYAKCLGSLYVMGGGRINGDSITPSRNWLRNTNYTMQMLYYLADLGKKVFVYSSNEFGGSLESTVRGENEIKGNGVIAFSALEKAASDSLVMKAIFEHWQNWNRVFAWALGPDKEKNFDPNLSLKSLSTSPLGLRLANEYLGENYTQTTVQLTEVEFRLTSGGIVMTRQDGTGLFWASQFGGQRVVDLAEKFGKTVLKLSKIEQKKMGKSPSPAATRSSRRINPGIMTCKKVFL